ncbi:MAG: ribulose-phosphate 3-epimerase [Saprospiraceae bacterium]
MPNHLVAPSLLAADFTKLQAEMDMFNSSSADWLHFDTMDGQFVPNISLGLGMLKAARQMTTKPIDAHLMIERPGRHIEAFREAGADHITVHAEACTHLHRVIQQIKASGAKAGVAINPATPISSIIDVLEDVDIVLIMSVNPGFGGQKFIYRAINKIEALKSELDTRNLNPHIVVDGGVGLQNAQKILQAGANVLVAGSAVFKAKDPSAAIRQLKDVGHEIAQWA